jgi:hypothetical protein
LPARTTPASAATFQLELAAVGPRDTSSRGALGTLSSRAPSEAHGGLADQLSMLDPDSKAPDDRCSLNGPLYHQFGRAAFQSTVEHSESTISECD